MFFYVCCINCLIKLSVEYRINLNKPLAQFS